MERIKSKILKYSEQLKEEYEAVQVSLNRLLEKVSFLLIGAITGGLNELRMG